MVHICGGVSPSRLNDPRRHVEYALVQNRPRGRQLPTSCPLAPLQVVNTRTLPVPSCVWESKALHSRRRPEDVATEHFQNT